MGTPQEDQQNQLAWTSTSFREGDISQRTHTGWNKALGTYVGDAQLSLHVSPPTTGTEALPKTVPDCGICYPTGLPFPASEEKMHLIWQRLDAPRLGDTQWGPTLSDEKGRKDGQRVSVGGGQGETWKGGSA